MNEIYNLIVPEGITIYSELIILVRAIIVFSAMELVTASFALLGSFKRV